MVAATLFVHNVSIFHGSKKIILGAIQKWSSEPPLIFEFYLSNLHFRLTQFSVPDSSYQEYCQWWKLSSTYFNSLQVVKNLRRPWP